MKNLLKYVRFLLFPFSLIYGCVVVFRNFLFDKQILIFKSTKFDIPTISVGNITAGGTGKTPFIEYLIRLLSDKYKITTISRGYGRKTKGILIANPDTLVTEIGDEPMQFFSKFYPKINVAVGEERAVAIPHLLAEKPETQVVLLDDAFQHRYVKPHFSILLIDYNRLVFKDFLLPVGLLREPISGINRADVIVITKCPAAIGYKKEYIKLKLAKYIKKRWKPIFYTSIEYANPVQIFGQNELEENSKVVLICGIAQNQVFINYVRSKYEVIEVFEFNDHHNYSEKDMAKIASVLENISETFAVLTTEKDAVKLKNEAFKPVFEESGLHYLPIEIKFISNKEQFKRLVLKSITNIS